MRLGFFIGLARSQYKPPVRQLWVTFCVAKSPSSSSSPAPPVEELKITYSSSSGPGGQNVNKVATKVDIRYCSVIFLSVLSFIHPRVSSLSRRMSFHINIFLPRFHVAKSDWLGQAEKELVMDKLSNYITKDGFMVVKSDKTRSQVLNQEDAVRKLRKGFKFLLNRLVDFSIKWVGGVPLVH